MLKNNYLARLSWIFCIKRVYGFCFKELTFFSQKSFALCKKSAERDKMLTHLAFKSLAKTKIKRDRQKPISFNLRLARFERATLCLEGRCSIQLSYRRIVIFLYCITLLYRIFKNTTSIIFCNPLDPKSYK